MGVPLRVLIIEDSADDAQLLLQELRSGGYEPECRQVENADAMVAALAEREWDIVIADYVLPRFSGMAALELLQQQGLDLPFIIVSGQIGEEIAVEAMKAGAHDYLVKGRLARLVPTIKRELRENLMRLERRRTEEALRESERRFRETLENISLIACGVDVEGRITFCNDFLLQLTGWEREEVIGRPWSTTFLPEDDVTWDVFFATLKSGPLPHHYENEIITRQGERRLISWSNTLLFDNQGNVEGVAGIGEDITDRKRAEDALREQLSFIQVLIDTIPTPIFYKDTQGVYLGCNKAFEKHNGLSREQIIGRTVFDIAPRDLAEICQKKDMALLRDKGVQIYESSVACADGTRQDAMFYKAVFFKSNGLLGGVVGAIFDITERKQAEVKLRYLSTHDYLTGLYNRSYFDEELVRLERSRKYPVSVIMVDVDGLKAVNDSMGHAAGDKLLQEAGQILKGVFRAEDVVARIGGDEFGVLLPGADETATAEAMTRIRQIIAIQNEERETLPISLSMGSATTHAGVQLTTVCRIADDRMYQDKLVRSGHPRNEPLRTEE